ncbi:hypothetical protein PUN28_013055 [Cardiocondyla obscurior]|uniref:Uncharacterized protein n=1 Tax=Cardiocondyla obscurior TaxID=286306 RepID=A0AAW2FBN9_9HYME
MRLSSVFITRCQIKINYIINLFRDSANYRLPQLALNFSHMTIFCGDTGYRTYVILGVRIGDAEKREGQRRHSGNLDRCRVIKSRSSPPPPRLSLGFSRVSSSRPRRSPRTKSAPLHPPDTLANTCIRVATYKYLIFCIYVRISRV